MRVTGVITCRNYADYVGRAIDSFFAQEYEPKRLVVVDDCSTDGSRERIAGRAGGDTPCPTSVVLLDSPAGVAVARNRGLDPSWDETDVFAFLDADDEYLPGKLARSVRMLNTDYGRIGMVYSDEMIEDTWSAFVRVNFKASFSLERLLDRDVVGGNMLVPKSAFAAVGRFDPSLAAADVYNLALRLSRDHVLIHLPEVLDFTRITPQCLRRTAPQSEWIRAKSNAAI